MLEIEENIVNIAMMAQKLLSINAMKPDEMEGYQGLTANIVDLAYQFEAEYGHIDYNAPVKPDEPIPDYWEDIEYFAKTRLLERYGIDKDQSLNMQSAYIIMPKAEIAEIHNKLEEFQRENTMGGLQASNKKITGYEVTFADQKSMEISISMDSNKKPYLDVTLYDSDKKELAHNRTGLPFIDKVVYLTCEGTKYKTYLLPFKQLFKPDYQLEWNENDPDRIAGKLECNGALMDKILKKESQNCSHEYLEKITHGYYPLAFVAYDLKNGSVDIAGSLKYMDDGFMEKSHSFHYCLEDGEREEAIEILEAYSQKTMGCSLREFQETRRQKYEFKKMVERIQAPLDTEYPCMPLNTKIDTAKNRREKTNKDGLRVKTEKQKADSSKPFISKTDEKESPVR